MRESQWKGSSPKTFTSKTHRRIKLSQDSVGLSFIRLLELGATNTIRLYSRWFHIGFLQWHKERRNPVLSATFGENNESRHLINSVESDLQMIKICLHWLENMDHLTHHLKTWYQSFILYSFFWEEKGKFLKRMPI